jgi:hypothetical protein
MSLTRDTSTKGVDTGFAFVMATLNFLCVYDLRWTVNDSYSSPVLVNLDALKHVISSKSACFHNVFPCSKLRGRCLQAPLKKELWVGDVRNRS